MELQALILNFILFINFSVLPLIFALAFLFFLWNAFRYFIVGGASDDGREKARRLMVWGILALVIMVSIWGIVNMLVGDFGFGQGQALMPDYIGGDGGYAPSGNTAGDTSGCQSVFGNVVWCPGSPSDYGI